MYNGIGAGLVRLLVPGGYWRFVLLCLCCAGCQSDTQQAIAYRLDDSYRAAGVDERIHFLVLHYTAEDFDGSLATLTAGGVSAHYLVPLANGSDHRVPRVYRLVDESRRAWHAGESGWRGRSRLNDTSIGIEIENAGYRRGLTGFRAAPYPPEQIAVVIALCRDIINRYHIAPYNVVGHSDIAWRRKQDPGPLFPWRQLAEAGVGVWPKRQRVIYYLAGRAPHAAVPMAGILERMARYGYDVTPGMSEALQQRAVAAFQMHFRPGDFRGRPDAETEAILDALLEVAPADGGGG
ncbi:N-acetylmuramoyl-L-alanine amidase [Martelella alba]|uniref:N-acetylmuramoyl-L-alanine amidase n=1 Tax=Martelella alba TaxID=2590451 RepID=UPI001E470EC4|nr:N-acetylmuramoyl-L-alanine amidase [Martelella alba]